MKQAAFLFLFVLCTGCSGGSWVDAPNLCHKYGGGDNPEEIAPYFCLQAGKSFTGEYECGEDGKVARVKCK